MNTKGGESAWIDHRCGYSARMYEDEDQGFMLLVLGVLAAVLMTVLWYVGSDDAEPVASTAVVAEVADDADHGDDGDHDEEEAAAPVATAEPTAVPEPEPTPEPTEVPAPAAPVFDPIDLTVTAQDGSITLEGVVPSQADVDGLTAMAADVVGADNVNNLLEIDANRSRDAGINSALFGSVASEEDAASLRNFAGMRSDKVLSMVDELTVVAPVEEAGPALTAQLSSIFAFNPIKFASGSAVIEQDSFAPLDEAAGMLTANQNIAVVVEGHTDNEGDAGSNQILSQQRAEAVVTYLVSQGVDEAQLTAEGFGAENPIADNGTAEGRAENRRIEFVQLDG